MTWVTPKTDWHGETTDGIYTGDRFNASDYNRIKNNIAYLYTLAESLYKHFNIENIGNDKNIGDYFYADEINKIENTLKFINQNTLNRSYGNIPIFNDNGNIFDFNELNRLEGATLDLYNRLNNQKIGRRSFKWNFGMLGGEL
jgi:hypothetical protein